MLYIAWHLSPSWQHLLVGISVLCRNSEVSCWDTITESSETPFPAKSWISAFSPLHLQFAVSCSPTSFHKQESITFSSGSKNQAWAPDHPSCMRHILAPLVKESWDPKPQCLLLDLEVPSGLQYPCPMVYLFWIICGVCCCVVYFFLSTLMF